MFYDDGFKTDTMVHKTPSINLIKNRVSFWERFFNWTLTIGRAVIILTEGLALGAFLFRFSLDSQLIDLHDNIKQKERVVNLLKNSETEYRNLQDRLAQISKVQNQGNILTIVLTDVVTLAPKDLIFNSITISEDTLRMDVDTQSVASLAQFINELRSYDAIRTVSLDRIENKTSRSTVTANITAKITLLKQAL